jgi:hypothetical protein
MLVTITQKADEVDLLVGEGTTIDLALKTYGPFVEDPRIIRVMKAAPSPEPAKAGTPAAAAGPSPGEKGPRDEKQQPSRSSVTASTPSKTSPPSKLPPAK